MMHQIILHDFTSGGRKVAPHNVVPRVTTVPRGIVWCIICTVFELMYNTVKVEIFAGWKFSRISRQNGQARK